MNFTEYLESKKIDPKEFALEEKERFMEMKANFDEMHPDSFTAQKLFLINPLRRRYPWKGETKPNPAKPLPKIKPKIRPKT